MVFCQLSPIKYFTCSESSDVRVEWPKRGRRLESSGMARRPAVQPSNLQQCARSALQKKWQLEHLTEPEGNAKIPTMKKCSILLAATALALAGCFSSKVDSNTDNQTLDDKFFSEYSQNPDPAKISNVLPLFGNWAVADKERNLSVAENMPLVAFFCHVFHNNPSYIDGWLKQITAFKSNEIKELFAVAFYLADNEKASAAFVSMRNSTQKDSMLWNLKMPLPKLDALIDEEEIKTPEQLDYCWGAYEATGELDYALRVFEVAVRESEERINGRATVDTTVLAARWSVTSFMINDVAVREAVNERFRVAPDDMLYLFGGELSRDVKIKIFDPDLLQRIKVFKEKMDDQSSSSSSAER